MSNIEDDVNELKSIMNLRTESGFAYSQKNTLGLQKSIRNVLQQLELKDKRIQELEEESKENKKKYLALLMSQFPDTTETYKKYKKELQELLEGEK